MSANGWLQFAIFSVVLLATVRPVGIYLARVMEGERTWLDPVLRPCERLIYKLCAVNVDHEMNWRQYITSGEPPEAPQIRPPGGFTPGQMMSYLSPVKKLAAGAALLMDWDESGRPPVDPSLAEQRASVCATCPKNSTDEISAWFTVPVSSAIKARLGRLHAMKLSTSHDDKLNVCSACLCPLRLKVWTPIDIIKSRLKPEMLNELDQRCWIPLELAAAG